MVLDKKETTVAYRCPDCGSGIMSAVGLFTLSADMLKLKCTCHASEMSIVYDRANSCVRLTIPCIFCDKPHTYNIKSSLFFSKELFALQCPYSDIDIGFVGEENNVKAALSKNELELIGLMEENGIESLDSLRTSDNTPFTDPQLIDIILYIIKDIDAEGKIYCECHKNGREPIPDYEMEREESAYDVEMTEDGIKITCRECGCFKIIPTDSLLAAQDFLNTDRIILEK